MSNEQINPHALFRETERQIEEIKIRAFEEISKLVPGGCFGVVQRVRTLTAIFTIISQARLQINLLKQGFYRTIP